MASFNRERNAERVDQEKRIRKDNGKNRKRKKE